MGKKKFDKKKALHFTIMHRSQRDPGYYAEDEVDGENGKQTVNRKIVFQPLDNKTRKALSGDGPMQRLAAAFVADSGYGEEIEDIEEENLNSSSSSSKAAKAKAAAIKRDKELREVDEYGLPIDGYDYSKHLSQIGGGTFYDRSGRMVEPVNLNSGSERKSMLASREELPRLLESITLNPKRLDPEMRNALELTKEEQQEEEEIDVDDVVEEELDPNVTTVEGFEEIDDDFVLQLMAMEKKGKVDVDSESNASASNGKVAFDFDAHMRRLMAQAEEEDREMFGNGEDGEEDEDYLAYRNHIGDDDDIDVSKIKGAEATNKTRDIDEYFNIVMKEYDDDQIGELDDVEVDETMGGNLLNDDDRVLLELNNHMLKQKKEEEEVKGDFGKLSALENGSKKNKPRDRNTLLQIREEKIREANTKKDDKQEEEEEYVDDQPSEEYKAETMMGPYKIKEAPLWDCETIVSTYSRTDNHPSVIKIETNKQKKKARKMKALEKTSAFDGDLDDEALAAAIVGSIPEGEEENDVASKNGEESSKNKSEDGNDGDNASSNSEKTGDDRKKKEKIKETPEERKQRKKAVKEERKNRRAEKKENKVRFAQEKEQKKRQQTGSALPSKVPVMHMD